MSCCACVKMSSKTVWMIRLLFVVFVGITALGIHLGLAATTDQEAVMAKYYQKCFAGNPGSPLDNVDKCNDDGVTWQHACMDGVEPAAEVSYGFDSCEASGFSATVPNKKFGKYAMIGGGGLSGLFLILCCVIGVKSASAVGKNKGNQMV